MIHTRQKDLIPTGLFVFFAAGFGVYLLLDARQCAAAVYDSLLLCAHNVIPSLFCFTVMTRYLTIAGAFSMLPRCITNPLCRLFRISQAGVGVFVAGLAAGFPLGAKTASELYSAGQISKDEAERLCAFCNNCGPSFIIGCIGCAVWGNAKVGAVLYLCQTLTAVLCGILLRFTAQSDAENHTASARAEQQNGTFSGAVSDSVLPMLCVCGFVVFFGCCVHAWDSICALLHIPEALKNCGAGILELTQGTLRIPKNDLRIFLAQNGFFLGWSGICVQMQSASFAKKSGLSLSRYATSRLFCAAVCPIMSAVSYTLFW